MFKRAVPLILATSLLVPGIHQVHAQDNSPRTFTSGELNSHGDDSDDVGQPLNDKQLAALSNVFNKMSCSRFSMNPPNEPTTEMHLTLRDARGESWRIDVYQTNKETNALVYKGQRIAPMRCPLSNGQFNALQSALHT
jgi:hypothetical protein